MRIMVKDDFKAFSAALGTFMMIYEKPLAAPLFIVWFKALMEFPLEEIQASFDACLRDTKVGCFKAPMPADVIEHMPVTDASRSRDAWRLLGNALRHDRSRLKSPFHDPVINDVIAAMGGPEKLCSFAYEEELEAIGVEFMNGYVGRVQEAAAKAQLPRLSAPGTKALPHKHE
jgi:hypothetical protein